MSFDRLSDPGLKTAVSYVFGSPVSASAFVLVDAILPIGNHTISEYLRGITTQTTVVSFDAQGYNQHCGCDPRATGHHHK